MREHQESRSHHCHVEPRGFGLAPSSPNLEPRRFQTLTFQSFPIHQTQRQTCEPHLTQSQPKHAQTSISGRGNPYGHPCFPVTGNSSLEFRSYPIGIHLDRPPMLSQHPKHTLASRSTSPSGHMLNRIQDLGGRLAQTHVDLCTHGAGIT